MEKTTTLNRTAVFLCQPQRPITRDSPSYLLDLFNARPHLARRWPLSHLFCPDSPRPAKCFSQTDTYETSVPTMYAYTCAHKHSSTCTPEPCMFLGSP